MNDRKCWYAGVDWASRSHHVRLIDGDGRSLGERVFKHDGEGLAAMADWLMATSGAERPADIAVAIEVPHGPVVETLLERGFAVHALNPKQMDRFRDRYSPAGAKDDSRDALVMASALRTDPHCFRRLAAADPVVVELREWSRIAEQLGEQRTQQANRLREQLWRYFPAFLDLDADLAAPWMLELWSAVPTPHKARRVSNTTITNILKRNRIRRFDAEKLLAILRQPHIPVAPGTGEAAQAHIALLVENLRLINRQITQAHHQLDELPKRLAADQPADGEPAPGQIEQRDVVILTSLPGLGRINRATLLAEATEALQRRDYPVLRALTGVAPVTRRSGKACSVIRRFACNKRLANAVYHWARTASQHDPISKAKYAALRARGKSHGHALRVVADRLLNVACAMLRDGTTFKKASHPI
ncbi:MAG: IS110 family transposase [Phycisphaerales bacterium]